MIHLVPAPKVCICCEDTAYSVPAKITTCVEAWKKYLDVFQDAFNRMHFEDNLSLSVGDHGIEFIKDDSLGSDCYTIDCDGTVRVCASDDAGILYAIATLLQLISVGADEMLTVPKIHLEDRPEVEYRAFMIDVARHYHPFFTLLRYVDLCFLYKIKYLQIHFIDDESYTLPSRCFPKLPTPRRHYSFEQIQQLNEYASLRGVILVPEYEGPGHAIQFTVTYPDVFANTYDSNVGREIMIEGGFAVPTDSLMCAGSESCREANKALITEISQMFPNSPYIHIGGDEAAISLWDSCDTCRAYRESHNLQSVYALYGDYVADMAKHVISLGRTPIVWEGFSREEAHRIPKETIVVGWESLYYLPNHLVEDGFKVINASWNPIYLVPYSYHDIPRTEGKCFWYAPDILKWDIYSWSNWAPESPATANPIKLQPTSQVLGGMMCCWEMIYEQEINRVIQNLAAVSERMWNISRVCNEKEFLATQGVVGNMAHKLIQQKDG